MQTLLNKTRQVITRYRMIQAGDRVVVGVSGGPDSIALLQILSLLSQEYRLVLIAAHLNHGLRGAESDADEEFSAHFAESLGVQFERSSCDIGALSRASLKSIEEVGREERYAFLSCVAQRHCADKIALGHHRHDQVETVLMNLIRGCGVEGLRGMPPMRDGIIIRPLLATTRDEILAFLQERGTPYRTDLSNYDNAHLRNRIRNRLLPLLKMQYNPNIERTLVRLSEIAGREDAYLEGVVSDALKRLGVAADRESITITRPLFLQFHEALQFRIIKTLLERLAPETITIGYRHVKSVLDMIRHGQSSGRLSLPGSLEVRRSYEQLSLIRERNAPGGERRRRGGLAPGDDAETAFFSYPVAVPGRLELREFGFAITFDFLKRRPPPLPCPMPNVVYLDYDKVSSPLCIRNRRPGDRMQPLGMKGTKKIKSYFIDNKVPRYRRAAIPLLADQESVLWVVGMGMSERVKVTDKTVTVLKAEIV